MDNSQIEYSSIWELSKMESRIAALKREIACQVIWTHTMFQFFIFTLLWELYILVSDSYITRFDKAEPFLAVIHRRSHLQQRIQRFTPLIGKGSIPFLQSVHTKLCKALLLLPRRHRYRFSNANRRSFPCYPLLKRHGQVSIFVR